MLRPTRLHIALALCQLSLLPSVFALESGPIVGHTTPESCTIWAYDSKADSCELSYWPASADATEATQLVIERSDKDTPVFRHEISGLKPRTRYQYTVSSADGEETQGSFTTAPPKAKPLAFSYVLTSCMDAKRFPTQPAWGEVIKQEPSLHLLVGDNTYADNTDYSVLRDHHLMQRRVSGFAELLASVPSYATWDDHDYGPNDSHGTTEGKEESLRAFKDLWPNPSYGTADIPGVFYTFHWGDVQYFVMDGRYHRDDEHAPAKPGKSQFGVAQRNWLLDGLKASKATFKIVVNGYDVMGARYPEEIKIIARSIHDAKVSGVLFHSGDIHRNDFKQQDHGMGYPVTQITSSGIARNPIRPWAMIDVDTTLEDPTLTARFFTEEELRETHKIRLSQLTPAAE